MRLNFRNIGEGIGAIGDAYNKVQLGRRYDEASKQQEQFTPTETTDLQGNDSLYFKNDDGNYELKSNYDERGRLIAGLTGDLAYPTRSSTASEIPQEAPDVDVRRQAVFNTPTNIRSGVVVPSYGEDTKRYGLGANPTEFRTTQYTPAERRTAGLEAQADFLAKQGRTEEASKLLDTVEARKTGALNQQLLQENVSNAGLRKRALEQGLATGDINIKKGGLDIIAGELGIEASRRTAQQNKDLDALGILMARAEALTPNSPERVDLENKIKATTAGLPIETQSSMVALAKNRMDLKKITDEADYIRAASSPEAFVKHYNEKLRDGTTAKLVKNEKDGTTSIVAYSDDGKGPEEITKFTTWGDAERNKVLARSPAFAKAKFEADIAHSNKIEQLQVAGKLANERTALIVRGKDIKINPESRTELNSINKRRTEILSKGEAITPDEEKELKKLDIRQDSVVQTLAIDNNQIAALLRSNASMYRTDNPPPRAGRQQSELTPTEYEAAKEQLRTRLAAERGSSFTDMNRNQQETYLNQEMDKRYIRKGLARPDNRFPAQGATTRESSSNAATDIAARLRAARDADLAAE